MIGFALQVCVVFLLRKLSRLFYCDKIREVFRIRGDTFINSLLFYYAGIESLHNFS